MRRVHHLVDGKMIEGASGQFADIHNPNTGEVQAQVALASKDDMAVAIDSAEAAFPARSSLNPQRRARAMFEFRRLLEINMNELAELLSREHGKVIADSRGEVKSD